VIYRYNGKITMIPTDAMSNSSYYRSDLIPTPPQTWTRSWPRPRSGPRHESSVADPVRERRDCDARAGGPQVFYPVSGRSAARCSTGQMNPHLTTPEAIRAAEYYRSLRRCFLPTITATTTPRFWMDSETAPWPWPRFIGMPPTTTSRPAALPQGLHQGGARSRRQEGDGTIARRPQTHSWAWCSTSGLRAKTLPGSSCCTPPEGGRPHPRQEWRKPLPNVHPAGSHLGQRPLLFPDVQTLASRDPGASGDLL